MASTAVSKAAGRGSTPRTPAKYWYFTSTYACPVCGREDVVKERRYTPKPDDPNERYEWVNQYDWCEN